MHAFLFSLKKDTTKRADSPLGDGDNKSIITTSMVKEESVSNEGTPLLANSANKDPYKHLMNVEESIEEHITFADIPMPGLWDKDVAGKNPDRIIILLFILLASMIVVRELVKLCCNFGCNLFMYQILL